MRSLFLLVLPALFPSWRFFDEITASPRIEIKPPGGPWHRFRPRPKGFSFRSLFLNIFFNHEWNEKLLLTSCAERLLDTENPHFQQEILNRVWRDHPDLTQIEMRIVLIQRPQKELKPDVVFHAVAQRS